MAEILVALTLVTVLTGSALALALSSRGVYTTDVNRTTLNQNLRIGMDLVGIDVRQSGQQLPEDVPAIEIVDGAGGDSDTLILRRNVIGIVLPLCKDIKSGSNADSVFVALKMKKPPLGCSPVADKDGDKWPDNLQAWKEYRENNGGEIWAFIYNPVTEKYEFFLYDAEDNSTLHLHKANDDKWSHTYDVDDGSRIYILEQKTYQLTGDMLEYYLNGDASDVRKLIYGVTDFQVGAWMQDGTRHESLGVGDEWSEIDSLQVMIEGQAQFSQRTMTRRLDTRFFPRNVKSL